MKRYGEGMIGPVSSCLVSILMLLNMSAARPDISPAKKREIMARIKQVAIVAPFFATDTQTRSTPPHKIDQPRDSAQTEAPSTPSAEIRLAEYTAQLRKLTDHASKRLPIRVAVRTPYTVLPAAEVAAALKSLDLTPEKLFQNGGRLRGNRFPAPDPDAVRKLAARLHADAVLLSALDEPRRNGGHYLYNALSGLDYRVAQVESRAGFFLLMADGTEALHDEVDVVHPLTHLGNREYLLADWTETQDVMIDDLLDEWTRYTPQK